MSKFILSAVVSLMIILLFPLIAIAESDADFLFEDSEQFYEPDIPNSTGPWVYESESLTVCIKTAEESGSLCYIADIYLRNNEKAYTGWAKKKPYTTIAELPHVISRRYSAVFGLTGDFVRFSNNKKGVMIRDGVVYFNRKYADVLAVLPSGEMEVYDKGTVTADDFLSQGVIDTLAFGPILVKDHKMTKAVSTHPLKPPNFRSGIGKIDDGHYLAIVPLQKLTFKQYSQIFIDYGCDWAYNLDGGHSAAMTIMGEQVNKHRLGVFNSGTLIVRQRPISDLILFGRSDLVPDVTEKPRYSGSR